MKDPRLMVADDDAALLGLMYRRLTRMGLTADRAEDGQMALDLIEENDYDVIVTDMYMPGADGLAVLQKAKERDPNLQIVVATASATLDNAVEALNRGAFGYLTKPFDNLQVFDNTVERALEHRRLILDNIRLVEIQRRRGDMLEEEFTQRIQQASQSRRELIDVFSSLPDGVLILEPEEQNIVLRNPSAEQWLERDAQAAERPIQDFMRSLRTWPDLSDHRVELNGQPLQLQAIPLSASDGAGRKLILIRAVDKVQAEPLPQANELAASEDDLIEAARAQALAALEEQLGGSPAAADANRHDAESTAIESLGQLAVAASSSQATLKGAGAEAIEALGQLAHSAAIHNQHIQEAGEEAAEALDQLAEFVDNSKRVVSWLYRQPGSWEQAKAVEYLGHQITEIERLCKPAERKRRARPRTAAEKKVDRLVPSRTVPANVE